MARWYAPLVLTTCALLAAAVFVAQERPAGAASPASTTAVECVSSIGPGLPPPASVPSGIPGFHASWYGQSGYATLCPGQRSTATVAFYNSGTQGWVSGRANETAFLGTWDPVLGADGEIALGKTGPDIDWPAPNRVAAQPADYVGPNQVAWFQFTIEAPDVPGTYRLYVRPLIEGATWMEDQGVFWEVRVVAPRSEITIIPSAPASGPVGWTREYTAVVSAGACVDLAFVDSADVRIHDAIVQTGGRARLSGFAAIASVNGAVTAAPFVSCATAGADGLVRFVVSSAVPNTDVRPVAFRDLDGDDALDVATEPYALGGAVHVLPAPAATGDRTITVGAVNLGENYFVDAAGSATYRYDVTDRFVRGGTAMTIAWFEQLLSRGDALYVSYYANADLDSTFTFVTDLGRQVPVVRTMLDSWDGGATQNDIGVRVIERPTNVDGIAYVLERVRTDAVGACDASSGAFRALAEIRVGGGADEDEYIDRNLAAGAYCYRVGVADPLSAQWSFAYGQPVVVANPPTAVVRSRSVDARLVASAGALATIDSPDVIKIAFDKLMRRPTTGTLLLADADGTVAELSCGVDAQSCTLGTGPETIGDVTYDAGFVITVEVRTAPHLIVSGGIPGLQAHATILAGDLFDAAGNAWDVAGSADVVVGAPD